MPLLLSTAVILGALDRSFIEPVIEAQRPALSACFAAAPPTRLTAKVVISHHGEVVAVHTVGAPDAETAGCIESALKEMRFLANKCGCGMVIVKQAMEWQGRPASLRETSGESPD